MAILCSVKKAISVLTAAALVLCGISVMAVAVPSDVDGNGAVSTADVRLVLSGILDETRLTEAQRLCADLDGDGSVTSTDARSLLLVTLDGGPIVTSTTAVTTTVTSPDPITVHSTTFTMPETTTTSGWDCISTTVTTTDTSTTVTYPPTTLPYAEPVVFTLYTDEEFVRAGRTFDLHVDISKNHSVVGYQMAIYYNPEEVTPQRVNEDESNPYAHGLNTAFYNENARWNFTLERDGLLKGSFVSTAQTGKADGARLFSLTFFLDELAEQYTDIHLYAWPVLCSVGGFEYEPSVHVDGGIVKIASSTTRPKTTTETTTTTTTTTTWVLTGPDGTAPATMPTTTQTTYVWTTTTYPPTTTTTWVLTGPDGTAPTTDPPTTMPTVQ